MSVPLKLFYRQQKLPLLDSIENFKASSPNILSPHIQCARYSACDVQDKAPSSAFLISRYILRLGQAAQKQQHPRCPNRKMYLEIRRADEWLYSHAGNFVQSKQNFGKFILFSYEIKH